ncbi:hypothetical protein ACOI9Q_28585, partial [Klebsiella sp. C228]|uniref:hypothetical protein n=1 Tax=Klebsiella sp. C228 TaxID=3409926 RepID=UPI003B63F70A
DVNRDAASYELSAKLTIKADLHYPDYEHSPWDPEDKAYAFIFESISTYIFHQTLGLNIEIGFNDGIKENTEIINLQFDDSYILLDADKGTLVSQTDNFIDDGNDLEFE